MLKWITLAPLVGAIINGILGKRLGEKVVGFIACASVGVSAILALLSFTDLLATAPLADGARRIHEPFFTWLKVGNFQADFAYLLDPLSGIYILFVTGVGLLIHIYAAGYMHGDPGYHRFFCYLNLFMFMMLTLVLADNLLLLFVGWEGVGLCSYLLIGYYFRRQEANDAAKKAFIVNRIGDFGYMIGIFAAFYYFGTITFFSKGTGLLELAASRPVETFGTFGVMTAIALLLFVGATGKSAQIPLYVWLPDAMAGPTPVSALIHAATMVTAGVYLMARCSPFVVKSPTAMLIIAVIGAATAIVAATIGLAQNDIKKILAYSTVSQLGFMFLACGVGAFVAGIFHVMTHAFFKALLFLGAGSVIHGMHEEQDIRKMGGLRKYMRITSATMMVGWLAISGFPLLSGFFSKDEILWRTWSTEALPPGWGQLLWLVAAVTAVLTAIYMTRLMVLTFWGSERFKQNHHAQTHDAHHHATPHESPLLMTLPLVLLAILSIFGGYVGVPPALSSMVGLHSDNKFEHFLEPSVATYKTGEADADQASSAKGAAAHEGGHDFGAERLFTFLSILLAVAGLSFGVWVFNRNPLWKPPPVLENKYYVDEFYDNAVVNPIEQTSRHILWKVVDVKFIDGFVNWIAQKIAGLADILRYTQNGFTRNYAAVILIGAIVIIGYFGFLAMR
ncbi:MAG: NADH-quinone oxidoreductase subunit L [Acidobacteria bacterium]|nr:NADH-quinone oxidoreductase subunit L [Acidobacteriota bacterium]